ncbi:MAG TPA: CPBP family intramembrane glutamic endopeptidase [Gemmatimonadaceae bacterium]|nr:CPBP family intramembrane glutamic endopeptidase [Gemmatimonadaceae bacterium]
MTARAVFIAADGRLRAPWRIIAFFFLAGLCTQLVGTAFGPLLDSADRIMGASDASRYVVVVFGLLLAHALMLYGLDKRPWSFVSLDGAAAQPRILARGWIIGALPILVPSLLLLAAGWLSIRPSIQGSWLMAAVQVSLFLLPAALAEELLSRGYVFASLREWLGQPTALAITSVGFGVLHLGNPGADARSVLLVILAGVFLGAVLIFTRSLYAAWMAHWAWNWVMAVPLHVAVSGQPMARPDYQVVDSGPDWVTGGVWGPEGGAGAALGMIAGLAYLYIRRPRQ